MNFMVSKSFLTLLPALAFLTSGVFAQTGTNQPRIACSAPAYDFGKVGNTAQVVHVFQVANEGAIPLVIKSVDTGCGCTAAKSGSNTVGPGSNTEVTVKFDTANRSGPQRKAIYVQSNDRVNPIFRLELTGDLIDVPAFNRPSAPVLPVNVTAGPGTVRTSPGNLEFGRVKPGDHPVGQVIVSGEGTNEFKVLGAASTCTNLSLRVEPMENRRWKITAKLLPRLAGRGEAEILIRTTHPAMGELKVPVAWEALSDIYATPAEVSLVVVPGQTNAVCRYIAFRSHSGKSFQVEKVEVPETGMEINLERAPNNTYRCEIQGIRPSTNLNGRNFIAITDNAGEKRVEVPIRAVEK